MPAPVAELPSVWRAKGKLIVGTVQVSAERDSSNQANVALKAELDRYRDVTGNTVEALEREKAVKAQLETQNKAQVGHLTQPGATSCGLHTISAPALALLQACHSAGATSCLLSSMNLVPLQHACCRIRGLCP